MRVSTSPSKDSTSESSSEEDGEAQLVFRVTNPDADREERKRRDDSQLAEDEKNADEHHPNSGSQLSLSYQAEPPHSHSDVCDEIIASSAPTTPSLVRKQSKMLSESEGAPVRIITVYESNAMDRLSTPIPMRRAPDSVQMNRVGMQTLVSTAPKPFLPGYSTEHMNNDSKKVEVLTRSSSSADTGLTAVVSYDNCSTNSTAAASNQGVEPPIRTSTAGARFENARHPSKYAKASYSLTNNPDAIKVYREMAEKTNDPLVQLAYAKYLLEVAGLYDHNRRKKQILTNGKEKKDKPAADSDSSSPIFSAPSSPALRHMSYLDHVRFSFDSYFTSGPDEASTSPSEDTVNRRKRKQLEDEGVRWIRRLAKEKVGEAAYLKAKWMEASLYGLKDDPAKTFRLYTIGAKTGIPEAMYALGVRCERDGKYGQAFENYREAADLDFVDAILVRREKKSILPR